MDVEDHQGDAASELATARSLHEWARKLPQPAKDKEHPAIRKRLEQAEDEDKKRKPPAERLQSALSRVDHRQRQAQAAKDALKEAQQAIEVLDAECLHQDTLLAKDQEELQVAQSLRDAWGPTARDGEGAPQEAQPLQGAAAAAQLSPHELELINRLYISLTPGIQSPELLKELAGSLGVPAAPAPPASAGTGARPRRQRGPRGRRRLRRRMRGSNRKAGTRVLATPQRVPPSEAPVPRRGSRVPCPTPQRTSRPLGKGPSRNPEPP